MTDAQVEDPNYLFVTSSFEIMYLGESGEIAWNLIEESNLNTLTIEADRNLAANRFISLLNRLSNINIPHLEMVVSDPTKETTK